MVTTARILIAGGGIGGLTAALALRRAGLEVEVHEQTAELRPVGAGLTLQPNAILALRRLGLGERVERAGAALRAGALLRWDGAPITRVSPDFTASVGQQVPARSGAALRRSCGGRSSWGKSLVVYS